MHVLCHRAIATTPPEEDASSTRLRRFLLPSPDDKGLGFRTLILTRLLCVHVRYGPVTRLPSKTAFVDGLQVIWFPSCLPSELRGLVSSPVGLASH